MSEAVCKIEKEPENLVVLRQITERLADFGDFSVNRSNVTELEMDRGTSFMVGLYKNDCLAVARNFASGGSIFPRHAHNEWELLLIYKGTMELFLDGQQRTLGVKDFYYIEPGTPHHATFPEDCWFLAITIPAADAWPEGN